MSDAAVSISNSTVTINLISKTLESFTEEDKKVIGHEVFEQLMKLVEDKQAFKVGTASY